MQDLEEFNKILRPLHTIEVFALVIAASFFSKVFLMLTAGLVLHLALDYAHDIINLEHKIESLIKHAKKSDNK